MGNTSSLVNYVSSNGTKFWTGNSSYQNDVFGIGVDNGSGLSLAQSNSMNTGSGNGTGQAGKGNMTLSASSLSNQQFLMIGDDTGELAEQTTNLPAAAKSSKRLTRTWLAQNTGSVGAVNLSFDLTGLKLSGGENASKYRLMVNNITNSSDFTTGSQTYYTPTSINGNLINFTGVSLQNNQIFTLITYSADPTLPATWVSFTANKQGDGAILDWSTADEANVAYYVAEQSANGTNYFPISKLPAYNKAGINDYVTRTNSLLNGMNYFRIKRVDLDGDMGYSAVRTIYNLGGYSVAVEPNPVVNNMLRVRISIPKESRTLLSLISMDGRLIQTKELTIAGGTNFVEIDISRLANGIYIISALIDNNIITQKLIKQ